MVNLYPFEATAARPDLTVEELIENIDIGGPAMVRSASKNFESVAVVTDPADYPALAQSSPSTAAGAWRRDWSWRARRLPRPRATTAGSRRNSSGCRSRAARCRWASGPRFPRACISRFAARGHLRYGENPHQKAALYIPSGQAASGLAGAQAIAGQGAFLQQPGGSGRGLGHWRRNLRGPPP